MSYPEPIPALDEDDWVEFLARVRNFKLTDEQKEMYKEGMRRLSEC